MSIGETIRNLRLQNGLSQGDIEERTGMLRCYLSRVENGHSAPSLDTLSKIAAAMSIPLAQFFSSDAESEKHGDSLQFNTDDVRFLGQVSRHSHKLNDNDRKLILLMVKKMAASATRGK